jgi:hypothetical protein
MSISSSYGEPLLIVSFQQWFSQIIVVENKLLIAVLAKNRC